MSASGPLDQPRGATGRILVIGGGGVLGIRLVQPALRDLDLGARTDCLEKRPPRRGEAANPSEDAA